MAFGFLALCKLSPFRAIIFAYLMPEFIQVCLLLAPEGGLADAMRAARNWAEYEQLDSRLHELIAVATGNPLLVELHRIVNAVRLSVVWSNLEIPRDGPPDNYHSFSEHDKIISALEQRDRRAAHTAMRNHLKSVRATLLKDD